MLEHVDEGGFLGFELGADGAGGRELQLPGQRLARRSTTATRRFLQMNGREVFKFATRVLVSSAEALLETAAAPSTTSTSTFPTRRTSGSSTTLSRKLGFPEEKVVVNVDRYGNTSSGSIPLALADASRDGRLQPGKPRSDDRNGRRPHVGLGADRWTHPTNGAMA